MADVGIAKKEGRWGMLSALTFCHFVNDYYAMTIPPLLPFLA